MIQDIELNDVQASLLRQLLMDGIHGDTAGEVIMRIIAINQQRLASWDRRV